MEVFDRENEEGFVLLYSFPQKQNDSPALFYTLNFSITEAYESKDVIIQDADVSVVHFSKSSVTLSNNQVIPLHPTELSTLAYLINELLVQLPKLKSKCERQEEVLLDYRQRLGITEPASPERQKKKGVNRDLLNPRVKKPTAISKQPKKRGFVDEDEQL